jgi:gluconolactonase
MSGTVEIRDPRFASVVGKTVAFEKLASGFQFTEGPLWHATDRYLLFSDMPGDHLRKWSAKTAWRRSASPAPSPTGSPGIARAA